MLAPTAIAATNHAHGSPRKLRSLELAERRIDFRLDRLRFEPSAVASRLHGFDPSAKTGRKKRDSMPTNRAEPGVELVVDLPSTTRRFSLRHLSVQPMTQPTVKPAGSFAFESIAFAEEAGSTLKLGGSGRRLSELANERKQIAKFFLVEFFHAQRPLLG